MHLEHDGAERLGASASAPRKAPTPATRPGERPRDPLDLDAANDEDDLPVASSAVTLPLAGEHELAAVGAPRLVLSRVDNGDKPSANASESVRGDFQPSVPVMHSRSPPNVFATPCDTDSGSWSVAQGSALGAPEAKDRQTHSPHALTPLRGQGEVDATTDEASKGGAVESRLAASLSSRFPANDCNAHPLHTLNPVDLPSGARTPGTAADDPGRIDTTQRDLEVGPDIPSPTRDSSGQV